MQYAGVQQQVLPAEVVRHIVAVVYEDMLVHLRQRFPQLGHGFWRGVLHQLRATAA